jgi:hypothetical protein
LSHNSSAPRRAPTKFERKSGLPDAGKTLDVEMMDAASEKVEVDPSSLDFTLNGC